MIQPPIWSRATPAISNVRSKTSSAYWAASAGTSRVRMFRNNPARCSKRNDSRADGSVTEELSRHRMLRRPAGGCRESTAAPAPSPNRHALMSTPGSSSRYIAALLTSTQIDRTCSHWPERSSALATCQFGSAPAQPWPTRSKPRTSRRRSSRSPT